MSEGNYDQGEFALPADELVFKRPKLSEVLAALQEASREDKQTVSPTLVYGLSDLEAGGWGRIEATWQGLPAATRQRVLRALHDSSEAMFELSYRELALRCLGDANARVRETAIELLWTDESEATMRELMRLARHDESPSTRIAALRALAPFILLGEYGDIDAELAIEAQQLALSVCLDDKASLEARRRALEALANSSHPQVPELISQAYAHGNHDLKISAIFAMGRTCSSAWQDILLDELGSTDNETVYEATRACGQIQLAESVEPISELALSDDREIQQTAIWALGEIGGSQAFAILNQLDETIEDEETAAFLDEALAAAGMARSLASLDFSLLDD